MAPVQNLNSSFYSFSFILENLLHSFLVSYPFHLDFSIRKLPLHEELFTAKTGKFNHINWIILKKPQ
jgi:hypothetical protein